MTLWPFQKFRNSLKIIVQQLLLTLLNLTFTKSLVAFDADKVDLVKRSDFFPKTNKDFFRFATEWSNAYRLWNQGQSQSATRLRISILEEIYSTHNLEDDYFPPALSNQFFGVIGHHAYTGIHIAAQKIGLIPSAKRVAIVSPSTQLDPNLCIYRNDLSFVNFSFGKGITENPINWHLFERNEVIRSKGRFVEGYDLIDSVFRHKQVSIHNPFFSIDEDYADKSSSILGQFGLTRQDWFVGLHIRDGGKTPALRNQQIENYFPAIKAITDRGGWVIRIGGVEMPPLPVMPRVIDLTTRPNALREVHLFVLARSKFFIGTCSGPQFFPSLFGVPTLFTNQIGIGRSILTFSKDSIHLPKHFIRSDGRKASLSEMLESPFGYGELSLKEFADLGIHIQENSKNEILLATLEMFSRIDGELQGMDNSFDDRVAEIRSAFWWTSKGRFSSSYLQENESWFLK